jgi:hypothetical protein
MLKQKKILYICNFKVDNVVDNTIFFNIPLQAWTGPEGSRRLRLPDLQTIGT